MPLIPLLLAAKQAHDLLQLAHKALEHYRELPPAEQVRLRVEADRVGELASELAASTTQSVRGHAGQAPAHAAAAGREPKVVAAELRDALARFTDSAAREVATVAQTESLTAHYAARVVGFGARRLDRSSAAEPLRLGSSIWGAATPKPQVLAIAPTAPAAGSVADELEKLDALRRRGILTEAEFDAQKRALLG